MSHVSTSTQGGIGRLLPTFFRRAKSKAFVQSLALIVVAECITIGVAWGLLGRNANSWLQQRARQLAVYSERATADKGVNWSRIDQVPSGKQSSLFTYYQDRLGDLNSHFFPHNDGSIYVVVVRSGQELQIAANDPIALDGGIEANPFELEAYEKHSTSVSIAPIVDDAGTYLAAYSPVFKDGRVIGLVAAEHDEASLSDLNAIIRSTFIFSLVPGIIAALAVAYVLASIFVKPTDVLREIEKTTQTQFAMTSGEERDDPWSLLAPREKEIGELLRRGVDRTKDIAQALSLSPDTVNTYLKRVRAKTGWSKQNFAVQAMARRSAPPPTSG